MNRLTIFLLALSLTISVVAQNKKTVQQQKPRTAVKKTTTQKTATKTQTTKKTQTAKKPQTTTKKGKTTKKAQTANKPESPSIKGLQGERQKLQQQIKQQEKRLQANRNNVKQRLQNLMVINTEIEDKQRLIDTIRNDLTRLDANIHLLDGQLHTLQSELEVRKQRFVKSMRYMHRNRSIQNQLMFVFSAHNFTQMYRRMRFMREYAAYQQAQGEAVKSMHQQVEEALGELTDAKKQKNTLLNKGEQERRNLEGKQTEQQQVVNTLQKEQKTIEGIIADQRKRDAALNAQIDKLIAEEVARAKARAAAEAKRKAEEAAAKKRAEELARKKAAAEAAARENARRIAEAKAREEKAKAAARAAAQKSAQEKAAAERAAREAEKARREAERKAQAEAETHKKEMAEAKRKAKAEEESFTVSTEDRRLSGNFEGNKGRLPMPITGPYKIVTHFGQYNVAGLKGVRLDSKGINIKGQAGARARSIFDGVVCYVFSLGGSMGVMVRHGSYISVYTNLSSVSVSRGQHVTTRQVLGTVGSENVLQFQLRKEIAKLNPESWLGR